MTIDKRIRRVFADVFEVDPTSIDDDFSVETCEAWDSMQSIVLASSLEDEFGVVFTEDELANFSRFAVVREFVEVHLQENGSA